MADKKKPAKKDERIERIIEAAEAVVVAGGKPRTVAQLKAALEAK